MTDPTPVLELVDVWRRYRVGSGRRARGLRASISRELLRRHRTEWHWALRGVDLRVTRGEALALVGRNGAGKSTLLRLAGGVGRAERGSVRVTGRVGALVDLGHELHGDLTGWQNAELAAVVAGMSRRGFRRRADEIMDFAELAPFADEPLRAYSDGMRARLAFSVMAHVEPDVLLVDEVLAVGDASFQRRSVDRIQRLREAGTAVVFVSHDLALARRVCERAIWLDHGAVRARGASGDVVAQYLEATTGASATERATGGEVGAIGAVDVLDEWGSPTSAIRPGDGLEVRVALTLPAAHPSAMLRIRVVRDRPRVVVVDTSTPVGTVDSSGAGVVFDRLDLAPGDHRVEVTLFTNDWSSIVEDAAPVPLQVRGAGPDTAPLAPPHRWRHT